MRCDLGPGGGKEASVRAVLPNDTAPPAAVVMDVNAGSVSEGYLLCYLVESAQFASM